MNKAIFVLMIVSVVLALGASGERYVQNVMRYAEIDANGNVINTNTALKGYSAIGFVCADAKCSKVSGTLWGGKTLTTGTDALTVSFPTDLQSPYGYGVYYFKPGFRLWEQTADVWGTSGSDPLVTTIYNAKMQTCHSPIASFSVTNAVQPNVPVVMNIQANLDAIAYAALLHRGPLDYVPPQLANDYYSVATRVTLEIFKDGVLVHTQSKDLIIPYSGSANLQFTWTPTDYGNYRAVVHTDVTDGKCIASVRQSAERVFQILQAEPSKECYTILNSLATSNQFPRVGDRIAVSFTKISNYALGDRSLTPVSTRVTYDIVRQADSVIVKSGTLNLAANPNAKDPTGHSFDWVTTGYVQGAYTIVATGICDSALCAGLTNTPDQASIQVTLAAAQRFAPVLDGLPDKVLQMNAPAQPRMIDLHQYTTDQDTPLSGITYYLVSQSDPTLISCRIEANRYVSCDAPAQYKYGISHVTVEANDGEFADRDSFTITVNRVAQAPVISNVPNVEFYAGECYSLDLDNYVTDTDNTPDELVWSVSGSVFTRITISPSTHVAEFCSDVVGEEQVTFRVTDPDGLFDTDESIVTVKRKNTNPNIEGLPDRQFCRGDGLKSRIIDLWQYASDAETADADLVFSIASQSDTGVTQCIIEDSRYITCNIYDKAGYSDITVRVSDGYLHDSDVFRISSVECHVNTPPVIDKLPDQSFPINTKNPKVIDLWQYAYDKETPDSGLVFSIVSQQDTAVADCYIESGRYISCDAKSKVGESSVVVKVSDGELDGTSSFIVRTFRPNTAPKISGLPDKSFCSDSGLQARIIDLWQYTSDAETSDDKLVFTLDESNPSAAHCAIEQNRYVSCTIGAIGYSVVRIEVSDGELKASDDFRLTSKDCAPANTAPAIKDLPDKEYCAGSGTQSKIIDLWQYAYDKETSDDKLAFSILSQGDSSVGSCVIENNRYVTCTVNDKIGSSDVKVQVSDGKLTAYDIFALKAKDCAPANTAPVIKDLPDKEYCAGSGTQSKIIDLWQYAYDKETSDDKLAFSILSQGDSSVGSCVIEDNRYVTCTVNDKIGYSTVKVQVSDGKLHASDDFKLKSKYCEPANTAPVMLPIPDQEFCAGDAKKDRIIDLWVYGYDKETPDKDLIFTVSSASDSGHSCYLAEGRYISCDIASKPGHVIVTASVSDGRLSAGRTFKVTAKDCSPSNTAPVWLPIPDQEFCAGEGEKSRMIDLWVYAYDRESPDKDLAFSLSSSSQHGHSCHLEGGRYVSCVIGDDPGEAAVTVTASDGKLSSVAGFKVNVKECGTEPGVIVLAPACKEIVRGTYEVRWTAADSDGDTLLITVEYSPDNGYRWFTAAEDIPNTGSLMWDTAKVPDQSTYLIRVTASDGKSSVSDVTDCPFIVSNNDAVFEEPDRDKSEIMIYRFIMEDRVRSGETAWFKMEMENTGDSRLEDVRVSITILDLGERRTLGPMDLSRGREVQLQTYLELVGARPGLYDVQVQVWNDKVRRTMYRTLEVTA